MHAIATTGPLTWFTVVDELRKQYRVVTFDQRWHGRGIRSAEFRLDDCADDAVAVLDALGIEQAIVVGYSMGGAVAQLLWHRHPERVAGLVLCSTTARWEGHMGERVFFRMLALASEGLISVAADKVAQHADAVAAAVRRSCRGRPAGVVHVGAAGDQPVVPPDRHGRTREVRRDHHGSVTSRSRPAFW